MHVDLLSGFGEDADGHVYAASLDGPVYRIDTGTPAPPTQTPPSAPSGGTPGGGRGTPPTGTTLLKVTLRAASRQRVLHTKRFVATVSCSERCTLQVSAKRVRTTPADGEPERARARRRCIPRAPRWRSGRARSAATTTARRPHSRPRHRRGGNATTRTARVRVLAENEGTVPSVRQMWTSSQSEAIWSVASA